MPGIVAGVKKDVDSYLSHFERLAKRAADNGQAWFLPVRKAAFARFTELGFPTTRHEEWRYTNVEPIANTTFKSADPNSTPVARKQIEAFRLGDSNGCLLVFVNGHYAPKFSSVPPHRDGVKIGSLAAAMSADVESVEPYLARYADYEDQAFTALNTALMEDGAFVYVPRGKVVEEPIQLLFVSTTSGHSLVSHVRNLIVADINSQATIVETYVGLGSEEYFTNAVTEIVAGENAVVEHYKVERETEKAFHVATLQLHQQRSSSITSHTVSLGGSLVRHDINAVLDGEGCECTLNGLYMAAGVQHVDNHLVVEHARPHCNSREFFKGVLDDRGRGIFSGRIIVREGAQKTDAKQTNMNMLLSEDAQVESKPQLEIFADDVKCTHAATIGQINEDAVFYLRSRGITEQAARSVLVYAFARESVERIKVEPLRAQLDGFLLARLPQGRLLREAV